jgi:hypothetical protein
MPCAGDSSTNCGAGGLTSLYKAGAAPVEYAEPTYSKMGCYNDQGPSSGHALEKQYVSDKMTVSFCANWAKHTSLKYFALKAGMNATRGCWDAEDADS